jgi:wobble nucleotide-excising tRNase
MIEALETLNNVGLLRRAVPHEPVIFGKVTTIYGENGRGKSTIAMLLRALAEKDADSIGNRVNWHSGQKPLVKIKRDVGTDVFADCEWRANPALITVFDEKFVEDNIHSGWHLEPEHRQKLYSFVLGSEAASLEENYRTADSDEKLANSNLKSIESELVPYRGELSLAQYLKIPPSGDIDRRISGTERKLQQAKDNQSIQVRPALAAIQWSDPELSYFWKIITSSYKSISDDAESRVKSHLSTIRETGCEKWLSDGQQFANGDGCPFCGEPLKRSSLFPMYRQYFDDEYRKLKANASDLTGKLGKELLSNIESQVQTVLATNSARAESWKGLVEVILPDFDVEEFNSNVRVARENLESLAKAKSSSPLEVIEVSAVRREVESGLAKVAGLVSTYKTSVESENAKISEFKQALASTTVKDVEAELRFLQQEKLRHSQAVVEIVQKYFKAKDTAKANSESKSAALKKLNENSAEIFKQYHAEMNSILASFGTNYTIKTCKDDHKGGTKRVEYELDFDGVSVGFVGGNRSAAGKSFADALSEGDRRTLALAFFLAKVRLSPNLANMIVVLDDPMCSLGSARRKATIRLLGDLAGKCRQLIVLCHDPYFLREFVQRIAEPHHGKLQAVELQLEVGVDGSTTIIPCNLASICASPYYSDYVLVQDYVESKGRGDHSAVKSAIRRLAEGYLRRRWVRKFEGCDALGSMLSIVRKSSNSPEFAGLVQLLGDLSDLNEFSRDGHHGSGENTHRQVVSQQEVLTHAITLMKVIFA